MDSINEFVINDRGRSLKRYIGTNKEVTVPDSVFTISANAFLNCSHVTRISIPSTVKSIEPYAFRNCINLEKIDMNVEETSVRANAFEGCIKLTDRDDYIVIDGSLLGVLETNKSERLIIPSNVKKITSSAFRQSKTIASVNIPNGVEEIGSFAFAGCRNLVDVIIPKSVKSIRKGAFADCRKLKVAIPETVDNIGENAFLGCVSATQGTKAFEGFTENQQEDFIIQDGVLEQYNGDSGCVVVPEGVRIIGKKAFSGDADVPSKAISVVLPEGIYEIKWRAFEGCNSLVNLVLPSTVTDVSGLLDGCNTVNLDIDSLQHYMKLPIFGPHDLFIGGECVRKVTIDHKMAELPGEAFSNCHSLEQVEIPEGVTKIGGSAFYNCRSLKRVILPESLEVIEDSAFKNCNSVEAIVLPKNLKSLGREVFRGCSSLKEIKIPEGITEINSLAICLCKEMREVFLPDSLKRIGSQAFAYCRNLESINIPDQTESIDETAFRGCSKMADSQGLIIIRDVLNDYVGQAESVVIPDHVIRIAPSTFEGQKNLKEITVPDGVIEIGSKAFHNLPLLHNIQISDRVIKKLGTEKVREIILVPGIIKAFLNGNDLCTPLKKEVVKYFRLKEVREAWFVKLFREDDAGAMKNFLLAQKNISPDDIDSYVKKAEKENKTNIKAMLLQLKADLFTEEKLETFEQEKFEKELGMKERTLDD